MKEFIMNYVAQFIEYVANNFQMLENGMLEWTNLLSFVFYIGTILIVLSAVSYFVLGVIGLTYDFIKKTLSFLKLKTK